MPKKPKPFKRPSVDVRLPGEAVRTWRNLPARDLQPGDIVADKGKVVGVTTTRSAGTLVTFITKEAHYANFAYVFAYTLTDG